MNLEDDDLDKMSHEDLLRTTKFLRDRIRENYEFLIGNRRGGHKIRSAQTGKFVSFAEFVEKGNLRESIIWYIDEAMKRFKKTL
jgi:hypothetical protein